MSELTRRAFVTRSAGTAAGMTAIGALVAGAGEADAATTSEPVVAYVRDPKRGEISVMKGHKETKVRDRELAARIARAAKK